MSTNNDTCGEDEKDSGYFSDGELPLSESDKVPDEYFFEHLLDDNDKVQKGTFLCHLPLQREQRFRHCQGCIPEMTQQTLKFERLPRM